MHTTMVRDLLSLDAPLLGNTHFSITNIGLYLTIGASFALFLKSLNCIYKGEQKIYPILYALFVSIWVINHSIKILHNSASTSHFQSYYLFEELFDVSDIFSGLFLIAFLFIFIASSGIIILHAYDKAGWLTPEYYRLYSTISLLMVFSIMIILLLSWSLNHDSFYCYCDSSVTSSSGIVESSSASSLGRVYQDGIYTVRFRGNEISYIISGNYSPIPDPHCGSFRIGGEIYHINTGFHRGVTIHGPGDMITYHYTLTNVPNSPALLKIEEVRNVSVDIFFNYGNIRIHDRYT